MVEKRGKGRPPSAQKSHRRSTTFPPGLYKRLDTVAKQEERTVNELIVTAVREFLKEHAPAA